jgi:hypothetical protein
LPGYWQVGRAHPAWSFVRSSWLTVAGKVTLTV